MKMENSVTQVFENLFGQKELETSDEVTMPTPSAVPSLDPEQTDASDTKHGKRRVRRRCSIVLGRCPTEGSRIRRKHAHHKHAHNHMR